MLASLPRQKSFKTNLCWVNNTLGWQRQTSTRSLCILQQYPVSRIISNGYHGTEPTQSIYQARRYYANSQAIRTLSDLRPDRVLQRYRDGYRDFHNSSVSSVRTAILSIFRRNKSPHHGLFLIRHMSSTQDSDERKGVPTEPQTIGDTVDSSKFAKFITGEVKPPVDAKEKLRVRRNLNRLIALNADREIYKEIQRLQRKKKEQARLNTAKNVHRALLGNVAICVAKFGAWFSSGSSGMLAEFIHSVVDCGNQSLLLIGLRDSSLVADRKHPYGYGKSIYFWALVSALGTFFLGAGVSMTHAIGGLMNPSLQEITWHVWSVLLLSFAIDGYVFSKTVTEILETKPKDITFWKHLASIRDPATLAILLEDGAACLGIVIALGGITATHITGYPVFDALGGVGISSLLGAMGILLVRMNYRFLLGQSIDQKIIDDIEKILIARRSIDSIGSVQSQWTGPDTFSYKAEVDFDGTYLAAKLMPIYQQEFSKIRDSMDEELQIMLALYAEDVIRTVEREVRHTEALVRKKYPGAEFIELEPMSGDADRLAIDDNLEAELRRVEGDALNRYLKSLRKDLESKDETTSDDFGGSMEEPRDPNSNFR